MDSKKSKMCLKGNYCRQTEWHQRDYNYLLDSKAFGHKKARCQNKRTLRILSMTPLRRLNNLRSVSIRALVQEKMLILLIVCSEEATYRSRSDLQVTHL